MRYLEGNTGSVAFATPITVGDSEYTGQLNWELGNDQGDFVPVDPADGADNAAVSVLIYPGNPQVLLLSKVADAVPFSVRATYPGVAGACSNTSVSGAFIWASPSVWINPFCVTAQ